MADAVRMRAESPVITYIYTVFASKPDRFQQGNPGDIRVLPPFIPVCQITMPSTEHPFHNATIPIKPFRLSHTQQQVDDMKTLIRLSPLGPATYENDTARKEAMGISMQSMREIKEAWLEYDWLGRQEELNALPQYIAQVVDTDPKTGKKHTFDVHFVGVMSEAEEAIPLILLHGWPGMGLFELTPMIEALERAGAPPLHLIIME